MAFPLPFSCLQESYAGTEEDSRGNEVPAWSDPVTRQCFWWSTATSEPTSEPTGGNLATVDLTLVLDIAVTVDHRDVFTVNGRRYEVIGLPKEWDHGPFGYQPNRQVVELKWVG